MRDPMNNTPNSGGRKKTTASGSGSVRKTESVNTNGPVGKHDGYSGKNGAPSQPQQPGGGQRSSSSSSGLLGLLFGGGLKRLIVIAVIVLVLFFLFRMCTGGCAIDDKYDSYYNSGSSGSSSSSISDSGSSSYDSGSSLLELLLGGSESDGGTSFGDLSELYLSDSYDATDSVAEETVSATTSSAAVTTTVSNRARDRYTQILGNGKDEVTVMIYLCGTDLESENGMGTADLNEMLHANLNDDKVNIIVETGGTKKWNNSVISNSTNQRYRVTSRGLQALEKNLGRKSMVNPDTLSDFIRYCAKNYPANRYILIMWDHGGGSISGYGYDQLASGSMTLDKISSALKKGGVKFDFIGFDACLMGTLENALVCEQYADYLIASEESEPGCGWYYTTWLSDLSSNPSINTVSLGKTIIDDFNNVCRKNYGSCATTLSIVDLAEFAGTVPEPFAAFSSSVNTLLDEQKYSTVADARSKSREFGKTSRINHVDLIDLATRIGTPAAENLVSALKGCVKYNRTSTSMSNSYGLSIYFPYSSFSHMSSAVKLYDSIDMDESYTACIKSFSSLAAGGQIATGGTTSSPIGSLLGGYTGETGFSSSDMLEYLLGSYLDGGTGSSSSSSSSYGSSLGGLGSLLGGGYGSSSSSSIDAGSLLSGILGGSDYSSWFEGGRVLRNAEYYNLNSLSTADMLLTEKNGGYVLSLSKDQWALVNSVQLNVFVDDGTGYIDLGMDYVFDFDIDGDLKIEWDGTWLAIDGHICPCYFVDLTEDNGVTSITERVPALLNGEQVYLMIVFENDDVSVLGAQRIYADGETDTVAKGLIPIENGDQIVFLCDFYDYNGNYQSSYKLADPLTVNGPLTVENLTVAENCVFCYCLTDCYENEFWTESLILE